MNGQQGDVPTLSVCIPAYNRPHLFRSALRSVLATGEPVRSRLEVVVSDDSTDGSSGEVWAEELGRGEQRASYTSNLSPLGMAANWNRCIELAAGRHVLILHDDDFLLPTGVTAILTALDSFREPPPVLLFGVEVVDAEGRRRRRQAAGRPHFLPPAFALAGLLSNSSFIRFPAMVVARSAYRSVAPFDEAVGEVADLLMWARLLAAYGLHCHPSVTAAYRVHQGALTTRMWRAETLEAATRVFDDHAVRQVLGPSERERCYGRWASQFVLAGAWRRVEAGDAAGALEVLGLFEESAMAGSGVPVARRVARRVLEGVAWFLQSRSSPSCNTACQAPRVAPAQSETVSLACPPPEPGFDTKAESRLASASSSQHGTSPSGVRSSPIAPWS